MTGEEETNGKAIAALILGIVGLVLVPLIPSVIAIFLGSQAQEEISRSPGTEGRGMAQAGVITGVVGVSIWGLFLALVALLVIG